MGRDEVLRLLDERQVVCRAQMKRFREEAERIAGLLDTCHVEVGYAGILAGEDIACVSYGDVYRPSGRFLGDADADSETGAVISAGLTGGAPRG